MLQDKIYRGRTTITTDTTQLLPYDFFGDHMPISLEVEDVVSLKGHVQSDDFKPRRCVYLDDIDKYLVLDVGGNYSAPAGPLPVPKVTTVDYNNPPQRYEGDDATPRVVTETINNDDYSYQTIFLYLIDGKTKEVVCTYEYFVELCPEYRLYDEVVDMCVSHEDMSDTIKVTFLVINKPLRSVSLARYRLNYAKLGAPSSEEDKPRIRIQLSDLDFFSTIVPPGVKDELALGWHTENAYTTGHTYIYVVMEPNTIIPKLKASMCCGELNPKYCNITVDEAGRYCVFIQSRIKVWAGPFLNFPVDVQYVVTLEYSGMNQHYVLMSPVTNVMTFDETEKHQPYKFNLTTYDARYLLCLEERKTRFLNFKRQYIYAQNEPPGDSYVISGQSWNGGVVADVYYPKRAASSGPPHGGNVTYVGYPTAWEQSSYLEPKTRETIWTLVDICDVYGGITASSVPDIKREQTADIVFLVDTSASMADLLPKVKTNMENFVNAVASLGITDWRVGLAAFNDSHEVVFNTLGQTPTMWSTNLAGLRNMADQLYIGLSVSPDKDQSWPFSAVQWAVSYYAWRNATAKCIVVITDAGDEEDPQDSVTASGLLTNRKIHGFVASYDSAFYQPIWAASGGAFTNVNGSWGSTLAYELGSQVADESGLSSGVDWWKNAAAAWQPVVLYQYTPVSDWGNNSLVTAFHDSITYTSNDRIIRSKINYLVVYDTYPESGGKPQNSIYIAGIVPGETIETNYIIKNESKTGTMRHLSMSLIETPDDVEVTITGMPSELRPGAVALISVAAKYNPSGASSGTRHIDVKYRVVYWMTHKLYCMDPPTGTAVDPNNPTPIPGPTDPDNPNPSPSVSTLYWVPNTKTAEYTPGWRKQIGFDPLYTLAYITSTKADIGDACYQVGWKNYRLYVTDACRANACKYMALNAQPISALDGSTGCCSEPTWLKVRGPLHWQTKRDYECRVNRKTWYIVNTSPTMTYVAYPVFDSSTMPTLEGTGFMVITYPDGNTVAPGQSIPVEMYWVPIFNPEGEEMTKFTKDYVLENTQNGGIESIWDTNPGLVNNVIYNLPEGSMNTMLTHTYIETIFGDGMDVPVKPDQPLNKMDLKLLDKFIYYTATWLDVDYEKFDKGYRYLIPAGVWAGVPLESGERELEAGVRPEDVYDYREYLSPVQGLKTFPTYIDHKFKANPEFLFNATSEHPYQLAPFNEEYAKPYMATKFVGNVLMRSNTLGNTGYVDGNKYDDDNSDFVPCTPDGDELVGWKLEDFWPVPGDFDASIKKLATENDYYFKRTVFVKNRNTTDALPIRVEMEKTNLPGFSLIGLSVLSPGTIIPPGDIVTLEATFQFHYTYQEAKYLNMIKEALFVPRFEKTLPV